MEHKRLGVSQLLLSMGGENDILHVVLMISSAFEKGHTT